MSKGFIISLVVIAAVVALYFAYQSTQGGDQVGGATPDPNMPQTGQAFPGVSLTSIYNMSYAIAVAEGFYAAGSVPQQANNPGDLELGSQGYGTIGGKTIFASLSAGWEALYNQVYLILSGKSQYYNPSQTIAQMGLTYSGGDPNWAANVAATLSVTPDTTLADWMNA